MTDLTKLKELAELASKATPGPWWIDSHGHCMVSESQDHRTIFLTNDGMGPATRHPETGNLSHWPNDWDASYIASADPTTILALIAEVERLHRVAESAWSKVDEFGNKMFWQNWDQAKHGGFDNVLTERDQLKAENAALRSALTELRSKTASPYFLSKIDAALEGGGR